MSDQLLWKENWTNDSIDLSMGISELMSGFLIGSKAHEPISSWAQKLIIVRWTTIYPMTNRWLQYMYYDIDSNRHSSGEQRVRFQSQILNGPLSRSLGLFARTVHSAHSLRSLPDVTVDGRASLVGRSADNNMRPDNNKAGYMTIQSRTVGQEP